MKMAAKNSFNVCGRTFDFETSKNKSNDNELVMGASCRRSAVSQKSPTHMSTFPNFTSHTHLHNIQFDK
jgi:hypothetical protein